jgi:hypothetical protein
MNELTPYDFDQTSQGWPLLDHDGKYLEAAEAIDSYITSNEVKIADQDKISIQTLFFHAGQEYAMAGKQYYSQAIKMMQKSYKSSQDWNLYVDGSIAFLSEDQLKLKESINKLSELAQTNDKLVANANLLQSFLDGMTDNLSYASIYDNTFWH